MKHGVAIGLGLGIVGLLAQGAPSRSPRVHRPVLDTVEADDGTATTPNWAGYVVRGTGFTAVEGSWIVPAVKCPKGDQYASFWVGLDGYGTSTVEQTGTSSDCNGRSPSYYAWYEFYPAYPVTLDLAVHPGDAMYGKVEYVDGAFEVTIENVTTGKSRKTTQKHPKAERVSAEWIAEAPENSGTVQPLSDFGTVDFGLDATGVAGTNAATDSTTSGALGAFTGSNGVALTMTGSGHAKATPSALSSDGTSFTVTWDAAR